MPFISRTRKGPAPSGWRTARRLALLAALILWLAVAAWETHKPLMAGAHIESPWYPQAAQDVTFIADITSADAYGRTVMSQGIFDQTLAVIRSARRFIVLDYFLLDERLGSAAAPASPARNLSGELRDALLEQRRAFPDLQVLLITDPINDVYGGSPSPDLTLIRAAGVSVVVTDLNALRDSNFMYSSLWRLAISWWSGTGRGGGWLPNPLDEESAPITFASWARLVNFKANHRKVVIADDGRGGLIGVVGSANPHDASSANSNAALKLRGAVLQPLLDSELAIAHSSGWKGQVPEADAVPVAKNRHDRLLGAEDLRAQVLTEGAIRSAILQRVSASGRGDNIDIAMFYVADRGIVESLLAASRRGVKVRLILDPNQDAFGHPKSGIPNQPVASELVAASDGAIHVRWYRTHGEQFHTKLVMVYDAHTLWLTLGSANLTRRNIADYNLEANVSVETPRTTALSAQLLDYFDTLWSNRAGLGIEYTADFGFYADPSQLHYWLYRLMEGTGLSTF
ncbi:MAG TPA: phospholipase D-like domain-containing protein [Steroidobacteraceae bacterium]|nr:phospholipase D-like domain-containing protein [Steroidobacteraceae bacterium]